MVLAVTSAEPQFEQPISGRNRCSAEVGSSVLGTLTFRRVVLVLLLISGLTLLPWTNISGN
jgi:hypothetical protein